MIIRNARARPRNGRTVTQLRTELWLPPLLLGLLGVGAWQVASSTGLLPGSISSPMTLFAYLAEAVVEVGFWRAVGSTLTSWALGFMVAVVLGAVLGVIAGMNRYVDAVIYPVVEFFRPIPSVVYLPLVVLVAGTGKISMMVLVVGAALWPVILQSAAGVKDTDPVLRDVARAYGLSWRTILFRIILPSAAPFMATGIRIAATISLVVVIATELLATGRGMGGEIATAYETGRYEVLFGISLAAAVLGMAIDHLVGLLEARILRWHPAYRK